MSMAAVRAQSRKALHDHMARPAFYYGDVSAPPSSYLEVTVRLHGKRGQIGDLPGTNLNYAETVDRKESVVFWREQVSAPLRGALVVFSATEGYWVDTVDPADGPRVTASVTPATPAELVGLAAP